MGAREAEPTLESPFVEILLNYELRTIFEVGSRDELDAIDMQNRYNPSMVHVFEPNPEAATLCRSNLAARDKFDFHELALWHESGNIRFYPVEYSIAAGGEWGRNIGASSCFRESGDYGEQILQKEIVVVAETLAAFMKRQEVTKIDLLCMDVQGAALNVLRGASSRLADIRFILTEAETRQMYQGEALFKEINGSSLFGVG